MALVAEFQLASKLVVVAFVAAVATGAGGKVSTVIVFELALVPPAFTARTR